MVCTEMKSKAEREKRRKKRYIGSMICCGLIFVGSFGMYLYTNQQYKESQVDTDEAQIISGIADIQENLPNIDPGDTSEDTAASRIDAITDAQNSAVSSDEGQESSGRQLLSLRNDPQAVQLAQTDIDALEEVNEDVLGWICIPDTLVNYPLMQGEDNQFYLEHTWKGKANSAGSIFLECQCSPDFTDFNTIIYGHRMSNTSMFGTLASYKKQSFWEEHKSVYICLDGVIRKYDIFASYEPKVTDCTYWVRYIKDEYKQQVIDFALEKTVIDCGITPQVSDEIITLSTCTGNGHATRWVVQAVLTGEMKTTEDSESLRPEDTM